MTTTGEREQQMYRGRLEGIFFVMEGRPTDFYSTYGGAIDGHGPVQIRFHVDGETRHQTLAEHLTPEYAAQCLLRIQAAYAARGLSTEPGQIIAPNRPSTKDL